MPYKPMSPKDYENLIKLVGWQLIKGKMDWNLYPNYFKNWVFLQAPSTRPELSDPKV